MGGSGREATGTRYAEAGGGCGKILRRTGGSHAETRTGGTTGGGQTDGVPLRVNVSRSRGKARPASTGPASLLLVRVVVLRIGDALDRHLRQLAYR